MGELKEEDLMGVVTGIATGNVLGSLLDGFGALSGAKSDDQIRLEMLERQIKEQKDAYSDIAPKYQPYIDEGKRGISNISDLGSDLDQYNFTPDEFSYSKNIQDFLDPSMKFQQEEMRRHIEASQANKGGLLSGGALKELQQRGGDIAQTYWGKANQDLMNDKNFVYGQYFDNAKMRQSNLQQQFNNRYNVANSQTQLGQFGTSGTANARVGVANNIGSVIGDQIDPMAGNSQVVSAMPYMTGQGVLRSLLNKDTMGAFGQYMTPQGTSVPSGNVSPQEAYYRGFK